MCEEHAALRRRRDEGRVCLPNHAHSKQRSGAFSALIPPYHRSDAAIRLSMSCPESWMAPIHRVTQVDCGKGERRGSNLGKRHEGSDSTLVPSRLRSESTVLSSFAEEHREDFIRQPSNTVAARTDATRCSSGDSYFKLCGEACIARARRRQACPSRESALRSVVAPSMLPFQDGKIILKMRQRERRPGIWDCR
jgi:hypothetical protein